MRRPTTEMLMKPRVLATAAAARVRFHFQKRPLDLQIAMAYTIVMSGILLGLNEGNLLAILLVTCMPGYVLVSALFPTSKEIDWLERLALSFGLSIAVVPLVSFLLNFTPVGIRFTPIVASITGFTILVGVAAWWRRVRLPLEDRLAATIVFSVAGWMNHRPVDRVISASLVASLIIAGITVAYVVLKPVPSAPFTEFYILGPNGNASGYPTNLTPSQPGIIIVSIVNHEGAPVYYTVRVDLVGVQIVFNATSGHNETVELNRTVRDWYNVTLQNEQSWSQPYAFTINSVGLWKLQFLLQKNAVLTGQRLQFFVRVS